MNGSSSPSTTVAVTGVAGFLGQRLLARLAIEPGIGRIVGLDVREPERRAPRLEVHRVDIAGHELKPLLESVDVLVHLAAVLDPIADEALMARVNIGGTRHILDAAGAVGVRKIVRVSTAAVYGASPTNPVPLTEDAPLRPNVGFAPAVQAAEAERRLQEWGDEHPAATVTTLRAAPILGAGASHLFARLLTRPTRVRVRDDSPPVQVVHVDDVAAALVLAITGDHPGVFNVAADGWLAADDAMDLLPKPAFPALPAAALRRALRRLWASGLSDVPPGVVPYLTHPWVIANDRLRSLGWVPRHTNEETLVETADTVPRLPRHWIVVVGAAAGALGAVLLGLRARRRRGR